MKKLMASVLLLAGVVLAQEDRLFDLGFGYSVWVVKFDLPTEVCRTPIHPADLQPGQTGLVSKANIRADALWSLDLTAAVRPPGKFLNHCRLGYTMKWLPYGDSEKDYHEGIADYNHYIDPPYWAYTYTKLDRTDPLAHEFFACADIPFAKESAGFMTLGCRYLCPFGTKWEQGWDRYAEETEWRSSDAHMSGFTPYIGIGAGSEEGQVSLSLAWSRYRMDWDEYKDTHCNAWTFGLGASFRF